MSELRTLEEINNHDDCGFGVSHVRKDELRAEVVKWVNESAECEEHALEDGEVRFHQGWQEALKRFCNLTEEDLK